MSHISPSEVFRVPPVLRVQHAGIFPAARRRSGTLRRFLTVAAATVLAGGPGLAYGAPGNVPATGQKSPGCIASGTEEAINAALVGEGAAAVLCPGAVFSLHHEVRFTAPRQQLYTQGRPTGTSRAVLRVADASLTNAVMGYYQEGAAVRNIEIDGNRDRLGWAQGGALVEMGGTDNQVVEGVYVHDTRSWSGIHFAGGKIHDSTPTCQNGRIVGNTVGPSGSDKGRKWADGISLDCGHSLVENNTVTDATDGGIVIFGAPGSIIQHNTVTALTRTLLGGINMVDYFPTDGNYTGTVVRNNTVDAKGAFIKVGIAMGSQVWDCPTKTVYGGTVKDNVLTGAHFGYGYAASGVRDWTVTGNKDEAQHVGVAGDGCGGHNSRPAGFQFDARSGNFQSDFRPSTLHYLLSVTEGPASPAKSSASPTGGAATPTTNGGAAPASTPTSSASGAAASGLTVQSAKYHSLAKTGASGNFAVICAGAVAFLGAGAGIWLKARKRRTTSS
ncbi:MULTISPECIES: right-handed parallel beta-helix repeat-containing protein [unclassified Streptomyces]|uniref:right-handed parallel beta-helix repeat-containing protein n=1 Tax=unclassified Streptomyces TaxID=2593676 RepID=UPI0022567BC2|nr:MULTISPECIES: right-handed parallel beta-helix repeat-containing protein [unclassified Streptomyces]MCX4405980.1 right-handed parallel beta-helix repeat-containing protein [Streptomyces sp. NBC_01764]MCX5189496.1 right-handed parallel beta-helix repeat-containing protein [Streptomyces sp. NBC_00268]